MTRFYLASALLAAVLCLVMLAPAWRERRRLLIAGMTGSVVLIGGGFLVYSLSSSADLASLIAAPATDSPAAMVGRLARRLEREPDDIAGWKMLGRSYIAMQQYPLAIRALQRAMALAPKSDGELSVDLAEAIVLRDGGEISDRAGELIEEALAQAPDSGKALFFGALAARNRGDNQTAVARLRKLLSRDPPPQVRQLLEAQILALDAANSDAPVVLVNARIEIAPQLRARIDERTVLFVFLRRPGRLGPPLAVKRLKPEFPQDVTLTSADLMLRDAALPQGETVELTARLDSDGNADTSAEDAVVRRMTALGSREVVTLELVPADR
ncbi:MAG: tetratricopeptide repeat protein [Steroidobacteraceae bacterium]